MKHDNDYYIREVSPNSEGFTPMTHAGRKSMRLISIPVLVIMIMGSTVYSYDHKYAAEFLSIGVGARALAMGGAFTSIADDATAAYWNPAGLRAIHSRQIGAMHAAQFANEIKYDFLSFVLPEETESFGISLIRMGIDDIPYTEDAFQDWGLDNIPPGEDGDTEDDDYDPINNPDGTEGNGQWDPYDPDIDDGLPGEGIDESKIEYKSDVEMALTLSYAKDAAPNLYVGINAKILRQGIGEKNLLGLQSDDSMFGFGFDLGAMYYVKPWWVVGASLHDAFGTLLVWNNGTKNTRAPMLKLGNSVRLSAMNEQLDLLAAVDFDIRFEGRETASQFSAGAMSADIRAGTELLYRKAIALRIGVEPSSRDEEPYGRAWNMTLGAGLHIHRVQLDYALSQHPVFDESHRVSLGFVM